MSFWLALLNAPTLSKTTRKDLSLADKIKVISEYEKSGKSYRRLADEYGVGRTQIQQTIKRKAEYMTAYEDNSLSCRKSLCTRLISDDLENSVWSWFEKARSMNISVSGPMLQERALLTAERLELKDFKASNG